MRPENMSDEQLQDLTYQMFGSTRELDGPTTKALLELKRLIGAPSLDAATAYAIKEQLAAKSRDRTIEQRPLVSSGEIEYRRRDDSEGRLAVSDEMVDSLGWMPDREFRVLHILFRHADETGKVSVGQTEIGRSCGLNRSQVCRLVSRLVDWGLLELVRRHHMGSKKPNEYRILPSWNWPREPPTREERPLVSLGQGEYRRDVMEGDV